MKRRIAPVLAVLLLLGAFPVAVASSAHAHSDLVSSDPADGAVLDARPETVSLTFNEDLLPDFVSVIATDDEGTTTELRVREVTGPTAVVDWPGDAPGGEWRLGYRVVSQDGHPVEGGIVFTYSAPSPSPTSGTASPSPTPEPTDSGSPTPEPTTAEPTPSPEVSPAAESTAINGGMIAVIAVGILAVVAIIAIVLVRRGR